MRRAAAVGAALMLAACNALVGIDDFTLDDANPGGVPGDGAASVGDAVAGGTLAVGGIAQFETTSMVTPLQSATATFARLDGTVVATDVTDGTGAFAFTVPTNAMPVDGFVQIGASGTFTGATYISQATTAVSGVSVILFDLSAISSFAATGGTTQGSSNACAIVHVLTATGAAMANARVVPTIGNVRYHDAATGRPSSTKTLTDASGTAWVFDIPPGTVSFAVGGPANEFGGRSITVGSRVCAQLTIVAT